jgi:hypothetical protein
MLEADILWRPEFDQPEERCRGFFETWLRLGKNISHVIFPGQDRGCDARRRRVANAGFLSSFLLRRITF